MVEVSSTRNSIIAYLQKLVSFATTDNRPKDIEECLLYIKTEMETFDRFDVSYYSNDTSLNNNTITSYVWSPKSKPNPEIMLYSHIDVVSAPQTMFTIKYDGNFALGRGVYDMKFAIAVYLEVFRQLLERNTLSQSIGLMIVSDEETGGRYGTKYVLERGGYRPEIVIMPDGGPNWHIVEQAKGLMHVTVQAYGKSAHASRPWDGSNAVDQLIEFACKLRELFPLKQSETWDTTVTISAITGGEHTAKNQIPDTADVYLDIRVSPIDDQKAIFELIRSVAKSVSPRIEVNQVVSKAPFQIDRNNQYVKLWESLITGKSTGDVFIKEHGTADHHYFSQYGIPVIVSSPVGGGSHSEEEWVDLNSLVEYAEVLTQFLLRAPELVPDKPHK